ncbi:MAG: hypothetical protein DRR04_11425 [Gammaproteobacteria bacterium]|nr:MAG: hypothetical protein DRQ97_07265 [Gammaproteobacteria bacterium]RLA58218.1 MAG: hypothetical protein DRR04_11425 [Gammaproteobacteria bacterium]
MNTVRFNARELCSRKLWQLVNTPTSKKVTDEELVEALTELATRRNYLAQLQETGKLEEYNKGS